MFISDLLKRAESKRKPLYMVGMDSVPLWVLEELKDEKGIDAFRKLLSNSCINNMESTLPPMTGPAWPSIYTGLEPKDHGVPDFFVMKKSYTPDIVYYDSSAVPPFWKELAHKGIRCLVITPATDITLPDYGNIDMITGFPLKARTNSKELEELMNKHSFDGEPNIEKEIKAGKMDVKEASMVFAKSVSSRSDIAISMMNNKRYGFSYVCFTETDRLQHFVMNKKNWKEYLLPVYSEISKYIEHVMRLIDKDGGRLVIVSDHGAQPIRKKFLLNNWLMQNDYLFLKEKVKKDFMKGSEKKMPAGYAMRERIMKSGLRSTYDRMPYHMKRAAYKVFSTVFTGAAAAEYTRMHLFDFDMKKTKVFAAISNDPVASIWINDSRFATPVVKSGKEKLIVKLKEDLSRVKTSDGKKMFVNIFDGKDYYNSTKKFISPDLLIEAQKGHTIDIFNFSKESMFMDPEDAKSGDHIREGIFGTYPKVDGPEVSSVTEVKSFIMKNLGASR
jgi:predicted AlkP superfamily phosphohydrolase/phosphomutase